MTDKPLAAASERLKGKPGRPKKAESGHIMGTPSTESGVNSGLAERIQVVHTIAPRLLDLEAAALYLGVSTWTLRELANKKDGVLPRVRIPLPKGDDLRKLLFDREDLDRLIEGWKGR